MNNRHPWQLKKNLNSWGCFGATSSTALPIQPIYLKVGPNWPNRQCCLAGSSKTAPSILIFSIAMGAEYLSYVKSIATFATTFYGYIISVLASVEGTNHNLLTSSSSSCHILYCLTNSCADIISQLFPLLRLWPH